MVFIYIYIGHSLKYPILSSYINYCEVLLRIFSRLFKDFQVKLSKFWSFLKTEPGSLGGGGGGGGEMVGFVFRNSDRGRSSN